MVQLPWRSGARLFPLCRRCEGLQSGPKCVDRGVPLAMPGPTCCSVLCEGQQGVCSPDEEQ